jgi:hypothetical protein
MLNVGDDSLPFFAEIQKGSIDSQQLLSTISAALTGSTQPHHAGERRGGGKHMQNDRGGDPTLRMSLHLAHLRPHLDHRALKLEADDLEIRSDRERHTSIRLGDAAGARNFAARVTCAQRNRDYLAASWRTNCGGANLSRAVATLRSSLSENPLMVLEVFGGPDAIRTSDPMWRTAGFCCPV